MKLSATQILLFASKLPAVVAGISAIIHKVKDAKRDAKVAAVLEAVPDSASLAEFATGKDIFNDDKIKVLMANVAALAHDLEEAKAALQAGIVNSQQAAAK